MQMSALYPVSTVTHVNVVRVNAAAAVLLLGLRGRAPAGTRADVAVLAGHGADWSVGGRRGLVGDLIGGGGGGHHPPDHHMGTMTILLNGKGSEG